jgi:hypothetical protein
VPPFITGFTRRSTPMSLPLRIATQAASAALKLARLRVMDADSGCWPFLHQA